MTRTGCNNKVNILVYKISRLDLFGNKYGTKKTARKKLLMGIGGEFRKFVLEMTGFEKNL